MPPAAVVCRKINPCRHPTTLRIYHCHARRTDPEIQCAVSLASPALLGEAREEDRDAWSKGRECFGHGHRLSQPGAGPVVSGGYIGDHESCTRPGDQGLLFCLLTFFFNAKSCPRIEIVSSQCCSRTQSFLFSTPYLNFSGGWRLIDVAISFYSTSVKSKLPSQRCCHQDSSRKAAEQPSRGGGVVGGGQGWQAASDQRVRLVFKTS